MFAGESGHASCWPAAPPFTVASKMSFSVYPNPYTETVDL
jgi:hypothetical protein